ncbi:MAG TPA: DJ-1/PfpI family protein [Chitinophaga sp.]|uniref:DJ-1/PfpI family protein n=1 Tax=Chitinophaga sp. TaxID=1869181 RepID=UPI002DB92F66|nr:DJ-1/PfpI family protein [Chitinophaga sp.]HEU4552157.1 DJ-1/PfpI family protein [Chitinophaga sp.]
MTRFLLHTAGSLLLLLTFMQAANAQDTYYCPPCNNPCDDTVYNAPGVCTHCHMQLVKQTAAAHARQKNAGRLKVAFYLQDGVEVLDFAGPLEVFSYAGFEVFIVSKTKAPVHAQGVVKITPDYDITDAPQADILAFFGGNAGIAASDTAVLGWIKKQTGVQHYFSVCTGAFILGRAGLLDGLTVTTFHESIASLQKSVPKARVLSNVRFVDNGRVITTAGISAGIDGALHLVAKIRGNEAAKRTAAYMEYDKWVPEQGMVVQR